MTIITKDIEAGNGGTAFELDANIEFLLVKRDVGLTGSNGITGGTNNAPLSDVEIANKGDILAGDDAVNLTADNSVVSNAASGTMQSSFGVITEGTGNSIINDGQIYAGTTGIGMVGNKGSIVNSGVIQSGENAIAVFGSNITIVNSGQITGASYAFNGGLSSKITFRNTGSAVGDVVFNSGANTFDGRNGTLNGTVHGGSNADTMYLGNDGETVSGGDGADTIYAGAGADTIGLTHLSGSDVDHIHRFAASQDTFDLDRTSFKALKVGDPVVFATGSKARSAADHLFYNAGTGALYYDADGSGTKAATLVAHLDTGLHLTAKNFDVT